MTNSADFQLDEETLRQIELEAMREVEAQFNLDKETLFDIGRGAQQEAGIEGLDLGEDFFRDIQLETEEVSDKGLGSDWEDIDLGGLDIDFDDENLAMEATAEKRKAPEMDVKSQSEVPPAAAPAPVQAASVTALVAAASSKKVQAEQSQSIPDDLAEAKSQAIEKARKSAQKKAKKKVGTKDTQVEKQEVSQQATDSRKTRPGRTTRATGVNLKTRGTNRTTQGTNRTTQGASRVTHATGIDMVPQHPRAKSNKMAIILAALGLFLVLGLGAGVLLFITNRNSGGEMDEVIQEPQMVEQTQETRPTAETDQPEQGVSGEEKAGAQALMSEVLSITKKDTDARIIVLALHKIKQIRDEHPDFSGIERNRIMLEKKEERLHKWLAKLTSPGE